jgi:hypothetical protein
VGVNLNRLREPARSITIITSAAEEPLTMNLLMIRSTDVYLMSEYRHVSLARNGSSGVNSETSYRLLTAEVYMKAN